MLFTGLGRSVLGETVPLVLGPWSLVLVKKRHFYVKKLVFFYKFHGCKKAAFLCKNPSFLQIVRL